jgi:hypothetical protein
MDDKDKRIQMLVNECSNLRNWLMEVISRCCDECSEYMERNCKQCRINKIKEKAESER